MGLRDIDRGYKRFLNRVTGALAKQPSTIRVGIFDRDGDQEHGDDGATVLEVAIWNEFGTDTIPERSFIRAWFDENRVKCRKASLAMHRAILEGKYTRQQALELLAQRFVGEIQRRMAQGVPPPNAPSTIARKGSAKPLINTGQLRSSISYDVDGKPGESRAEGARNKRAAKLKKRLDKKARAERIRNVRRGLKRAARTIKRTAKTTKRTAKKGARQATKAAKGVFRGTKRFVAKARRAVAGKKRSRRS